MKRLFQAAEEKHGITTPGELARRLNLSPQTVNNWGIRGISREGMLAAEEQLGISALWLKQGGNLEKYSELVNKILPSNLLSPEEITELISLYADCDIEGRDAIMGVARFQGSLLGNRGSSNKRKRSR